MPKKRKFTSVYDKCRVCLQGDGCMSYIFSEDIKPKFDELADTATIKIENAEKLPKNICHVCLYKLDMWIEFKQQFLRSHDMLREHLGIDEISEITPSLTKRKLSHSPESLHNELPLEKNTVKKRKIDDPIEESCVTAKKPVDHCETITVEDSCCKLVSSKTEAGDEKPWENVTSVTGGTSPMKQIGGRRGKTTERREASTKRWVARKRALLAATGENETETDSESSDEAQLSPVQKARAKCNAEKVVAESQRRIAKGLKSFDSNLADKHDGEEENKLVKLGARDSKSVEEKGEHEATAEVETMEKSANENTIEMKNSLNYSRDENFLPHSVRSELTVDDATFIVTSTLVLTEPHHLSRVMDLPKDKNVAHAPEITNQERNTDIIDAVQLRRVSPKSTPQNDKKLVERCLNIEVEGTELDALRRVQVELANFVETKLIMEFESRSSWKPETEKQPCQSLNQQLKMIVEKSIKKNLSTVKSEKSAMRGENTFSPEFVRAAMRSKIFQPRVLLARYEVKEKKMSRSNEQPLVAEKKSTDSPIASLGKRRSVLPVKFTDYDALLRSAEASDDGKDAKKMESLATGKSNRHKTYGPALTKLPAVTTNKPDGHVISESGGTPVKQNILSNSEKTPMIEANVSGTLTPAIARTGEKHICGVCGDSFGTRREVEIHFSAHKSSLPTIRQVKQKMMRCKRCHEIVEARYVKLHVCNSSKNKANIQAIPSQKVANQLPDNPRGTSTSSLVAKKQGLVQSGGAVASDVYMCFVCDKTFEDERILKDHLQKHCDDISDEEEEEEQCENEAEMGQGEEEATNDKELYQCAICGESLDSEDALETHVEKHLFDDEDDNPNLISIGDREKTKKHDIIHVCNQCNEPFDSEMLLMLHMQAHEEEVAIAEWERRGVDNSQVEQHICVICDQLLPTEAELSEHLDVHNGNAHVCLLCDKPFLTLEELQAHVNTH